MHIAITGGLGFVGGRLASHFANCGVKVTVLTRRNSFPEKNIINIRSKTVDWKNFESICYAVNGVDLIIHSAGPSSYECLMNPEASIQFLNDSTYDLLRAAKKCKIHKLIYLSTCHVYSNKLSGKIAEDFETSNSHPYALANLAGEKMLLNSELEFSINSMILRLTNIFGYPIYSNDGCWQLFVNQLVRSAHSSRIMEITGGGGDRRDFIPMKSACNKIQYAIEKLNHHKIVNISSGKSHTTIEMANVIKQTLKKSIDYNVEIKQILHSGKPLRDLDIYSMHYDFKIDKISDYKYELLNMMKYLDKYES
jgi:UDP-glucose 4-epimerase